MGNKRNSKNLRSSPLLLLIYVLAGQVAAVGGSVLVETLEHKADSSMEGFFSLYLMPTNYAGEEMSYAEVLRHLHHLTLNFSTTTNNGAELQVLPTEEHADRLLTLYLPDSCFIVTLWSWWVGDDGTTSRKQIHVGTVFHAQHSGVWEWEWGFLDPENPLLSHGIQSQIEMPADMAESKLLEIKRLASTVKTMVESMGSICVVVVQPPADATGAAGKGQDLMQKIKIYLYPKRGAQTDVVGHAFRYVATSAELVRTDPLKGNITGVPPSQLLVPGLTVYPTGSIHHLKMLPEVSGRHAYVVVTWAARKRRVDHPQWTCLSWVTVFHVEFDRETDEWKNHESGCLCAYKPIPPAADNPSPQPQFFFSSISATSAAHPIEWGDLPEGERKSVRSTLLQLFSE